MRVNFRRILAASSMRFELHTQLLPEPGPPPPEEFEPHSAANLGRIREAVLGELCDLLSATDAVTNPSRLLRDLHNREKRTGTAIGDGIAVPHVRTVQARRFAMAFARSREGLPFFAADGEPVHLFFGMVAPPYDDRQYLAVYRDLASSLLQPDCVKRFLAAETPNDVWLTLESVTG
jgi:mannitol/fructose-specific phosphotransferase system IIA component (Ntr-type)